MERPTSPEVGAKGTLQKNTHALTYITTAAWTKTELRVLKVFLEKMNFEGGF